MLNYSLCVIHSSESWGKVKEILIWGVSDRWRKTIGRVKVNDELLFYLSKKGFTVFSLQHLSTIMMKRKYGLMIFILTESS